MGGAGKSLGGGYGRGDEEVGAIMVRVEQILALAQPDIVLVYGDVNSTLAAALVAAKLGLRVGHVEAGLGSGDWTMWEEVNRVLTDRVSELLFTPSRDAGANLVAEGVAADRIHFVGNVMIDSLCGALPQAAERAAPRHHGLHGTSYVVATLHRPPNVDDPATLPLLPDVPGTLSRDRPSVLPVHPRAERCLRPAA